MRHAYPGLLVFSLLSLQPGAAYAQTQSSVDPEFVQLVDHLKKTWNTEDTEGMLRVFAPDVVVIASGRELNGIDAFRKYLQQFFAVASDEAWEPVIHSVSRVGPDQAVLLLKARNRQKIQGRDDIANGFHTLALERRNGRWLVVHEHWSYVSAVGK